MKRILLLSIVASLLLATSTLSTTIAENNSAKSNLVIVLEWLDMEYDVISNHPDLSNEFSEIVFLKLSSFYIAGISSDDIRGSSKKAICKMRFDVSLRRMLNKDHGFNMLEKYLENLWLEIKPSFKENSSCELNRPPRKKSKR